MEPVKFAVIGNPAVDGLTHTDDANLARFGLQKGDANVLDHTAMFTLGGQVEVEKFESGGAGANLAYTLCKLGHSVCFLGPLGTDPAGRHFFREMVGAGMTLNTPREGYRTTELFVFVTPDGVRTMVQSPPPRPSLDDKWVDETLLKRAEWLVVEGYVARDWPEAVTNAVISARENGTRVALQLPAPKACDEAAVALLKMVVAGLDLILGNEEEFETLHTKADATQKTKLAATPQVITHSGKGAAFHAPGAAVITEKTQLIEDPADNTGAGDAFAAGFLAVYAAKGDPAVALRRGNQLGGEVIRHLGPRLANPMEVWMNAAESE